MLKQIDGMQKQVAIWCARFGWGKFGALGNLANKQFSWVGFSSEPRTTDIEHIIIKYLHLSM